MRASAAALLLALTLGACVDPQPAANLRFAEAFLAATARQPGVVRLPSGLQYRVIRSGPPDGLRPKAIDQVLVQYEGKLPSGEVFDSTYQRGTPAAFGLDGVIPAWTEGLQLMRPGDVWMLYAPPGLAYGPKATGPIPPNSALIFKVELLAVAPADPRPGPGPH